MTDLFEDIDLNAVEAALSVEIYDCFPSSSNDNELGTAFRIYPPLLEVEYSTLMTAHEGDETKIGNALDTAEALDWVTIPYTHMTVEGKPDLEQVEPAKQLARELITLRGLKLGKVVYAVGSSTQEYLVRAKSDAELAAENDTVTA